jgi:hypothetical protein
MFKAEHGPASGAHIEQSTVNPAASGVQRPILDEAQFVAPWVGHIE